jgi:prepilin-type N-terminal cleavage/methylation domain-containing protein
MSLGAPPHTNSAATARPSATTTQPQQSTVDGGFTLVELLIVIVVLGILSAIVVFSFRGVTGRANDNACSNDYRSMATAIYAVRGQTGSFPVADDPLTVDNPATPEIENNEAFDELRTRGFMEQPSTRWQYAGGSPATGLTPISPCTTDDVP